MNGSFYIAPSLRDRNTMSDCLREILHILSRNIILLMKYFGVVMHTITAVVNMALIFIGSTEIFVEEYAGFMGFYYTYLRRVVSILEFLRGFIFIKSSV